MGPTGIQALDDSGSRLRVAPHREAGGSQSQRRPSLHDGGSRDFAVLELVRSARPLSAATIAARLGLDVERVHVILGELEKRLTFLYRSRGDDVTWAYPVTVDETPHRATFSTGEEVYSP